MDADESSTGNQLHDIIGEDVDPVNRISQEDITRLDAAKRTLDQNFHSLDGFIDGDLAENPVVITHQDSSKDTGFEVLRLLHNYLASLYSCNETVRVLVNRLLPSERQLADGAFTPATGGSEESYYGKRLAFLRGLRHDSQHGGFSCLSFDKSGELGAFAGYHLTFDSQRFINDSGLRTPSRFLEHTNDRQSSYPICYIGTFHKATLQPFLEDVDQWVASTPR